MNSQGRLQKLIEGKGQIVVLKFTFLFVPLYYIMIKQNPRESANAPSLPVNSHVSNTFLLNA